MTELEAFRIAAYALVESELRAGGYVVDVRLRSTHVEVSSVEVARGVSLLDAVDRLREKSK